MTSREVIYFMPARLAVMGFSTESAVGFSIAAHETLVSPTFQRNFRLFVAFTVKFAFYQHPSCDFRRFVDFVYSARVVR